MSSLKVALIIIFIIFSSLNAVSNNLEDHQLLEKVYGKLKVAIGDLSATWPSIDIEPRKHRVAVYKSNNTILIDQSAFKICETFGNQKEDALAFIIGHELTHFYQQHFWKESGFASYFFTSNQHFTEKRKEEEQADIYGAFFATQAGYQSISLVPILLDKIYEEYSLNQSIKGDYPPLKDRKELANKSCKIASQLIHIYSVANYLLVLGKYEEAFVLYDYVKQTVKFKELFNNLGVSSLLGYQVLSNDDQLYYPLDIDLNIPLLRPYILRSPKRLLEDAIQNLSIATQYDATYYDAFINLIAAYTWKENLIEANKLIQQLDTFVINKRQKAKFKIMAGNFYAENQKKDAAINYYRQAIQLKGSIHLSNIAQYNLSWLKGEKSKKPDIIQPVQVIEDQIDNLSFSNPINNFDDEISIDSYTSLQIKELNNSIFYFLKFKKLDSKFKLQIHTNNHKTKRGIGLHSPLEDIKSKYSKLQIGKINHTKGSYLINYKNGLVFKCDVLGKVKEWGIFSL